MNTSNEKKTCNKKKVLQNVVKVIWFALTTSYLNPFKSMPLEQQGLTLTLQTPQGIAVVALPNTLNTCSNKLLAG